MSESAPPTRAALLAGWIAEQDPLPAGVSEISARLVIDTLGLAMAARNTDYVHAVVESWKDAGSSTLVGSTDLRSATAAAMTNGTAAHGEDFDSTFEGCPVHAGAVVVPAVLAAAEEWRLSGRDAERGIAIGTEVMCRLGLIARKGVHAAGFHPTAVLGTMAATAGVAAAAGLDPRATTNALGIAGSMASGIIEYLADGTWTKRLHAGWAAQAGIRAAAMARAGFTGPATVFEGEHGLFHAFAPSIAPDFDILTSGLGEQWHAKDTAFKPYACGTMTQPFVDCAISLSERVSRENVTELRCFVGEGTVHRLWEPLELKQRPPNGYAAKFSTPYCVAVGFLRQRAGLAEFDDAAVSDEAVLGLAARVNYEIDPDNEYPANYTGYIRAELETGEFVEARQPHLRGGRKAPLDRAEIERKARDNIEFGGCDPALAERIASFADGLGDSDEPVSLDALR